MSHFLFVFIPILIALCAHDSEMATDGLTTTVDIHIDDKSTIFKVCLCLQYGKFFRTHMET